MADVRATHMVLTKTMMMGISQRSKRKYKCGAMGVCSVARKTAAATKGIEIEGAYSPMED